MSGRSAPKQSSHASAAPSLIIIASTRTPGIELPTGVTLGEVTALLDRAAARFTPAKQFDQ
jgi:hypothetical protein